MGYWGYYYPHRLTVAERQVKAAREMKKLEKKGRKLSPVVIEGRDIATTFWGKAWCQNLESYSDFENRLPRGRSYVINGSVCDLQIEPGKVKALVCGTEMYDIKIKIAPLPKEAWDKVKAECAGKIGSLIELLQGKLSKAVMEVVTRRDGGLFPKPREIKMDCSCPDWADLCKHLAAVLYGVGNRLDHQPELLFKLRQVDHLELIAQAGDASAVTRPAKSRARAIAADALADVFGVELEAPEVPPPIQPVRQTPRRAKRAEKVKPPPGREARPGARAKSATPARRARAGRTGEKR